MPVGKAERVEVVAGRLDLPAVDDLVAEAEEDVLDVAPNLRRWVQRAAPPRLERPEELCGKRDVHAPLGEPPLELLRLDPNELVLDRRLDRLAHGVQRHAGLPVAYLAQRLLELAAT